MSVSALRDIERGVSEGNHLTRLSIAQYFHCTMADLYAEKLKDTIMPDAISHVAEILTRMQSLSPKKLKAIYAIAYNDMALAEKLGLTHFLTKNK